MVDSASERSERAEIFTFCVENIRLFSIVCLVNHIFVNTIVLVFLTQIALFMTSYTDQKTRNLRTYLNNCKRAERASRKFSPFPVLTLLVNHIFVGAIPPEPPWLR